MVSYRLRGQIEPSVETVVRWWMHHRILKLNGDPGLQSVRDHQFSLSSFVPRRGRFEKTLEPINWVGSSDDVKKLIMKSPVRAAGA